MPNPGRAEPVHREVGRQQVRGRVSTSTWYNNSLQGVEPPDEYLAAESRSRARTAATPSARAATRSSSYYDHDINVGGPIKKDKMWWYFGTYRAQQNKVGAAELPVRQDVRHQAVERRRQGHLSAQSEQQVDRLLPVGPERRSRTGCRSRPTPTRRPSRRSSRTPAAGCTRASGTARSATSCIVEGALRRLRLLLPAGHQQPRQLLLARHRRARLGRRAPGAAARSRPQAVDRGRDLLPRHRRHGQPHLQDGWRAPQRAVMGRLYVAPRRHEQHRAGVQQRRLSRR